MQVAYHKQQGVAAASGINFQRSIEAAAEQLRTTGWAIIEGVLDLAECEGYVEGVWRWLGSLGGGISREDPTSWQKAWPPTFKGIINTLEVAHQVSAAALERLTRSQRPCWWSPVTCMSACANATAQRHDMLGFEGLVSACGQCLLHRACYIPISVAT